MLKKLFVYFPKKIYTPVFSVQLEYARKGCENEILRSKNGTKKYQQHLLEILEVIKSLETTMKVNKSFNVDLYNKVTIFVEKGYELSIMERKKE